MLPIITLVANSGLQFWDIELPPGSLPQLRRKFWEEVLAGQVDAQGAHRRVLREVVEDAEGRLTTRGTHSPVPEEEVYELSARPALDMQRGRWIPLPYFRIVERDMNGRPRYAKGPTNWVRARLTPDPAHADGEAWRLTLVFDTGLVPLLAGKPYVGLSEEDYEGSAEFACVADAAVNAWFVDEHWMSGWLCEVLKERLIERKGGRSLSQTDMPRACEHFARYLVFLALLEATERLPVVKVEGKAGIVGTAVDVDLVLDIGNSRSCGILIEQHPDEQQNFANSYPLRLRDLSQPELSSEHPFESRVEFVQASFGRLSLSRQAGRAGAFDWKSVVRVGPEAVRLAGARLGTEGPTGLSSPKRYLWDDRPATQGWKFNGRSADGAAIDPPVSGPFTALVDNEGRVVAGRPGRSPAMSARFSRSSLFAFMLGELVLQAVCQINAPGNRRERRDATKPRRLRSVLLTMPPGMPVAEQRILAARARDAMQLAWGMLGLPERQVPVVRCELDEATATQLVWVHNEVAERMQGDSFRLMRVLGRMRPECDAVRECLRVASIDIGGGTTDLMITTYTAAGTRITPEQNFRESFKLAGDDVLERVIVECVLPPVEAALTAAGAADARALLVRALGQDQGGQSEQQRHLRRLCVSTVMERLGLAILQVYEKSLASDATLVHRTVGELVGDGAGDAGSTLHRALGYLDGAAEAAGCHGFALRDVLIAVLRRRLEAVISAVLAPMLTDLSEVVWHYDCDVLLLSGRPSRLPVITDIVLAKAPVPAHRVIGMHRYRVGERYPFRDSGNRIDDPKTTVVVGAALCVQAEGRLKNFALNTRALRMRSTARIIGRMDNSGQIRDYNQLLNNTDLDNPKEELHFTTSFDTTLQIGFRQLPVERWTATPLYIMEFAMPENARKLDLPLSVTVRRQEVDPDRDTDSAAEIFKIERVTDAAGDDQRQDVVRLRLQTLGDQEGYWRDTGRLTLI